jgi:aminoglycoside phosphotransferase (APT) family kinase protein
VPAPLDVAAAVALVRAAVPELDVNDAVALEGGWDSFVLEVDGEWIFRFPRRAEVEETLWVEIALLPALGPALPAAVPRFVHVVDEPALFVGYRKIGGAPLTPDRETAQGAGDLGRFLGALHSFPVAAARRAGVSGGDAADWRGKQQRLVAELEPEVAPLLPSHDRAVAHRTFADFLDDDANFDFAPAPIHYDVGPTHLLVADDGGLEGVIDWGDAAVGDPAADLAWPLHGAGDDFARAVFDAYPGASEPLRERALFYHRLGPWHEVVHGLRTGDEGWVETGLAGVLDRLPREPGGGR